MHRAGDRKFGKESRLPEESVYGLGVIAVPGFYHGLCPIGVVQRIGIELGLQGNAAALAVKDAVLTAVGQEVAGVELQARAVGGNGHGPAGFRVLEYGAGVAEYLKIVVITALEMQGVVVCGNIQADGLWDPEVHGRAADMPHFACGDAFPVRGSKEPGGEGKKLAHGFFRVVMACQVKITVVGQVEYRVLVADRVVGDVQAAPGIQAIGDADVRAAGEALVTGGAVQEKTYAVFFAGYHTPKPQMVGIGAGVEVVIALVGDQGVYPPTQRKGRAFEPVGVAAHRGANVGRTFEAVLRTVIAKNHIIQIPHGIGNGQCHECRAAVCNGSGDAATGYCVEAGLFAAGHCAEKFCHWKSPLNFSQGKGRNYVKTLFSYCTIFRLIFQRFLFALRRKSKLLSVLSVFAGALKSGTF